MTKSIELTETEAAILLGAIEGAEGEAWVTSPLPAEFRDDRDRDYDRLDAAVNVIRAKLTAIVENRP